MKKIIVYTTPTCVFCPLVKNFLKERGFSYEEINIAGDISAIEKIKELTGQMGVPVTVIDDQAVVGFNTARLNQLLE